MDGRDEPGHDDSVNRLSGSKHWNHLSARILHLENLVARRERNPGCLLRVQICLVGRNQEVSSSVPARTRITPSLGMPQTQAPHSRHTNRVLTRPLSAVRWSGRGSIPLR